MSFLEDGVLSSTSYYGRGFFRFDRIGDANKKLLKKIVKRQRRKFKDDKLIPRQLLQVLWNLGYVPGTKAPKEGMRNGAFLKFLRQGQYPNQKNRANGVWLHDKIEQEEGSSGNITNEIFIKCGERKFGAVSILRKEPGTIFR